MKIGGKIIVIDKNEVCMSLFFLTNLSSLKPYKPHIVDNGTKGKIKAIFKNLIQTYYVVETKNYCFVISQKGIKRR